MKDTTKMFLCAVAGAVIFREIYVHGYNKGQDFVANRLKLMINAYEAAKKDNENEEES